MSLCVNVCVDVLDVTHNDIRLMYIKGIKTHKSIVKSKLKVPQKPTTQKQEIRQKKRKLSTINTLNNKVYIYTRQFCNMGPQNILNFKCWVTGET